MTIIGQDRVVLWFQPDGPGSAFIPFGVGEKAGGMSGKTVPGPGRTPVSTRGNAHPRLGRFRAPRRS